mmetsp:Transcript_19532/g.40482  ORF Transcript_19532/g.40482 Transcript_19532/m.40482 type:complete len:214 (-) Transcript_19532:693-1334(-)
MRHHVYGPEDEGRRRQVQEEPRRVRGVRRRQVQGEADEVQGRHRNQRAVLRGEVLLVVLELQLRAQRRYVRAHDLQAKGWGHRRRGQEGRRLFLQGHVQGGRGDGGEGRNGVLQGRGEVHHELARAGVEVPREGRGRGEGGRGARRVGRHSRPRPGREGAPEVHVEARGPGEARREEDEARGASSRSGCARGRGVAALGLHPQVQREGATRRD